jgi:hypothetical protein
MLHTKALFVHHLHWLRLVPKPQGIVISTLLARLATGMCTICPSGPQIYEAGVLVYIFISERPGVSPVPDFVCILAGCRTIP